MRTKPVQGGGRLARTTLVLFLTAALGAGCGNLGSDSSSSSGGGGGGAQPVGDCATRSEVGSGPYAGRTYRICGPSGGTGRLPLVIGLHGGSINSGTFIEDSGGLRMIELAAREGFLTLFPDGSCPDGRECRALASYFWNDCRADRSQRVTADDLGYLEDLVDRVLPGRGFLIDRERVYVWGGSNGGFMALRVAQERPGLVRAVAAINAGEPTNSQCGEPASPTSVLFVRGTEDPWVPFDGGEIEPGNVAEAGVVRSADETLDLWVRRDGCAAQPSRVVDLPDRVTDDGPLGTSSTVTRLDFTGCAGGTTVRMLRVDGGGHTVPGETDAPSPCFNEFPGLGCTNRDVNGPEEVWSFFREQG